MSRARRGEPPLQARPAGTPSSPARATAPKPPGRPPTTEEVALSESQLRAQLRAMSRRGFAKAGVATLGALLGWRWLGRWAAEEGGLAWPLRRVLETNEAITRRLVSADRLAPAFPVERVGRLRVNGMRGLRDRDFQLDRWRLEIVGAKAGPATLSLAALQSLPRTEMVIELKCIEGWSTVSQWAGVRFADLARAFPPATRSGRPLDAGRPEDAPPYVSMATPDGSFYVGLDAASALHPQTLLAWEHDGAPLTLEHGAPLRLVTPLKYGIKNIKRVGTIVWTAQRPADYWAERGYDWFAGL